MQLHSYVYNIIQNNIRIEEVRVQGGMNDLFLINGDTPGMTEFRLLQI